VGHTVEFHVDKEFPVRHTILVWSETSGLRRPDSPKKLDNPYLIDEEVREGLKVAMSENKLSSKQIVELNKFCAMKKEQTFLYTLVGQNKIKAVQVFVGFPGINVNKGNYQGETPLMLACEKEERFPIVEILLGHPAINVNQLSKARQPSEMAPFHPAVTALHKAVVHKNEKAVKALLNHPRIDLCVKD
jgi:ankyrin repeat protein